MDCALEYDNRRVLVIDDNEAIHLDFRKILEPPSAEDAAFSAEEKLLFGGDADEPSGDVGFEVQTAISGADGLVLVEEGLRQGEPFAAAFVDMRMPGGWDGVTTIERLWKVDADLQVVICTAYSDTSWQETNERLGHSDQLLVVKKPFDPIEVSQAARSLTSKWNLTKAARQKMAGLESKVRHRTAEIIYAHEETIHCLSAASMYRDKETGAHIRRTGLYCEALARGIGWAANEVDAMRMTAPMHDVGKIGIPDAILLKPGRLTSAEFEIMKTHTVIGARLLSQADSTLLQRAGEIALNHHERWDGGGYPRRLSGATIPVAARMLSIADAFDAMSNDRVYRAALPEEAVLRNLQEGRGSQFDPELLDAFLHLMPEMRRIVEQNPDEPQGDNAYLAESVAPAELLCN